MIKSMLAFNAAVLFQVLIFTGCHNSARPAQGNLSDIILNDKDNFFYFDTHSYPEQDKRLPVGIFDSGTGGLTVLDAIIKLDQYNNRNHKPAETGDGIRDFQSECFIYLGDQANMPYGNYSREKNIPLLKEHILKDAQFLLGNKYYLQVNKQEYRTDKEPVKAIVIACNTATAYGKSDIESFLTRAKLKVKVIGVIDAGVRAALQVFQKTESGSIGLMATAGTVSSAGYVKALDNQITKQRYSGTINIFQQAGIGLAGAIDGSAEYISSVATQPRDEYKGPSELDPEAVIDLKILERYNFDWDNKKMLFEADANHPKNIQLNSVDNYISYHLVSLLEKIRQTKGAKPLRAIILGCTHYPFYTDIIQEELLRLYDYREDGTHIYRKFMANQIALIDPAQNTALELYEYIEHMDLFNNADLSKSEFYISMPNVSNYNNQIDSLGNFTYSYKYGRKAGFIQQYVKRVPFSKKTITPEVASRLKKKIPLTFELIISFNQTNVKMREIPESEKF